MGLMQPIATDKIQPNSDWIYEIKYDGFRAQIQWSENEVKIMSRNNKDLTNNFPEVIRFCQTVQSDITALLPLQLDGELVVLNNSYQANFSLIQKRGRLKTKEKIDKAAEKRPATFIAFDLIQLSGKLSIGAELLERKKQLNSLFNKITHETRLKLIQTYNNYESISKLVFDFKAEGIVAKRKASKYTSGKKHNDWLKEKNWRTIHAFLTEYNPKNDYFHAAVFSEDDIVTIGKCKHGLDDEAYRALKNLFVKSGERNAHSYTLPPAICTSIHTLDLHSNELREPEFAQILPETSPETCTAEKLFLDLSMLPAVDISNEDKLFWPTLGLTKADLLMYMREIFPYIIPHVKNRALTVIRCPDGVEEESFFQKNLPNYAPDYVDFVEEEDKRIQLCNGLRSLIWYANHSAIEYHVPFQTIETIFPTEIVFDLDPPNREAFSLAIQASTIIKQIIDELELTAFIKTSGGKGLQIHIPLAPNSMSYDETAVFTEAIAKTVERAAPTLFTTERFKKNRGERLYIDYVQHGKNRTIVAPYSPRKTEEATVATPLFWEEVQENLFPTQFTIKNVAERVQMLGCPWFNHFEKAREQKLTKVLALIQSK